MSCHRTSTRSRATRTPGFAAELKRRGPGADQTSVETLDEKAELYDSRSTSPIVDEALREIDDVIREVQETLEDLSRDLDV